MNHSAIAIRIHASTIEYSSRASQIPSNRVPRPPTSQSRSATKSAGLVGGPPSAKAVYITTVAARKNAKRT